MQWASTCAALVDVPADAVLVARLSFQLQGVVGRRQRGGLLVRLGGPLTASGVGQGVGPADEQGEPSGAGVGAQLERALIQVGRLIERQPSCGDLRRARVVHGRTNRVPGALVVGGQPLGVHRALGIQRLGQPAMRIGERRTRQRGDHGLAHAVVIRLELAHLSAGAADHVGHAQRAQQRRIALIDAGGSVGLGLGDGPSGHGNHVQQPP